MGKIIFTKVDNTGFEVLMDSMDCPDELHEDVCICISRLVDRWKKKLLVL